MGKHKKTERDLLREALIRKRIESVRKVTVGPFMCPSCQETTLNAKHDWQWVTEGDRRTKDHVFKFYCRACRFHKTIKCRGNLVDVIDVYNSELIDKMWAKTALAT